MMTVDLILVMSSIELGMPWEPMPESRKPWKGKWSGPRAGAALTWTVPVSMASDRRMACEREEQKRCRGGAGEVQERRSLARMGWSASQGGRGACAVPLDRLCARAAPSIL